MARTFYLYYFEDLILPGRCVVILLLMVGVPAAGRESRDGQDSWLGPCAIVASMDGQRLFVALEDACQLAYFDPVREEVSRCFDLPAAPTGLALSPGGRTLAITCADAESTVLLWDIDPGKEVLRITAGHTATSPVFSPDGQRLYVCNRFDNDVSVIDIDSATTAARVPAVREPIAAALTRDGQTLFVVNHLPATRTDTDFFGSVCPVVTVIDTRDLHTEQIELPVGSHSAHAICLSPDGTRAYIPHILSNFERPPSQVEMGWTNLNVISVLDTQQAKYVDTIGLDELFLGAGNPWGAGCTADGKWICINHAGTDEMTVLDRSKAKETLSRPFLSPAVGGLDDSLWGNSEKRRRISLPGLGPRGMAVVGSKVYITEYFTDSLAIVDLQAENDGPPKSIQLGPRRPWTLQRRGEYLFHCAKICYQHWQSCASCHPDGRTDCLNWDLLNDGIGTFKNTKSLLLAHKTPPSMFEAVRPTAESAVRAGITNILFTKRPEEEAVAIDAYLKSLRPVPSPHLVRGRLSAAARRGKVLFESHTAGCARCHPAPLFTDRRPHNVGTRTRYESAERFDTPTLVEVWRTAPYVHDGRYTTVRQLLVEGKHGLGGGRMERLSEQQINDLVEYVLSL